MITLTRDDKSKTGSHGEFELEGDTWQSLEQPWRDNKPYQSCVPPGIYELRPYSSPKYGDCYIMVNEDLNVYEFEHSEGRPADGRFLCLFVHKGNWVRNFKGCVGAGFDYLENEDMITSTKKACEQVNKAVIQEGSYKLEIIDPRVELDEAA
jgi:hypothetical protein